MKVWSIASGSSGNCYLIQHGESLVLMEAGISARRVGHEMARLGFSPSSLTAILVSHEHSDHWLSAGALSRRFRIPVVCTAGTYEAGNRGGPALTWEPIAAGQSLRLGDFRLDAFGTPHDAREPVGFFLQVDGASLCLATDVGTMTEEVLEHAGRADLVIIESNHDVDMLMRGPYPRTLKQRILGPRGHLSNSAAADAIVQMAGACPSQFWLAHLSHVNNSPSAALDSAMVAVRRAGLKSLSLAVALRDRYSLFWDSERVAERYEQLPLF